MMSRTASAVSTITTKVMILIVVAVYKSTTTTITQAFLRQEARIIRTKTSIISRTNTKKSLSMLTPLSCSTTTTSKSSYEVEQKFALINHDDIKKIQQRLIQLGFIKNNENVLIDWYYDTIDYKLIQQDCWLRLRQKTTASTSTTTSNVISTTITATNQTMDNSGDNDHQQCYDNQIWQLKRGNNKNEKQSPSSTVYQEIEGPEAFSVAIDILSDSDSARTNAISSPLLSHVVDDSHDDDDDILQKYELPVLPQSHKQLLPFARIYAKRSSWKYDVSSNIICSENNRTSSVVVPYYHDLIVDFDITDTGYAVGEVECIVEQLHQIDDTRHRIDKFLQRLLHDDDDDDDKKMNTTNKSPIILGKLEFYIQQKKPKLYQMLIDYGIM